MKDIIMFAMALLQQVIIVALAGILAFAILFGLAFGCNALEKALTPKEPIGYAVFDYSDQEEVVEFVRYCRAGDGVITIYPLDGEKILSNDVTLYFYDTDK